MSLLIEPELVLFPEDATAYIPVGSVTIPALSLFRGLVAVIHAADTDPEGRPILNTVAIRPDALETVVLVASDNYRIAICEVDAALDEAGEWTDAAPVATEDVKRLVAVLKSIPNLKDNVAEVTLSLGRADAEGNNPPRRLEALVEDTNPIARLKLRVLDGAYPDYSAIVPDRAEHIGTLNGKYLSEAARFVGEFDPQASGIVRQSRSPKGALGPFVFRSGRMTEVVMPVRTGEDREVDPETGEITESSLR